jgi:hypothetical protein
MKIINLFLIKQKEKAVKFLPPFFLKINEAVTVMTAFFTIQKKPGALPGFLS